MKAGCLPAFSLFHTVERHQPESERIRNAALSWQRIYASGEMWPAHASKYPRNAQDIGDKRDLPYLKDILKHGMEEASDEDAVVFTNGDILLNLDTPSAIRKSLEKHDCFSSFRVNIQKSTPFMSWTPREWAKQGQYDFGRDLFAFRVSWLKRQWDCIPDFIVGEWEWDLVMALMIRMENGVPITTKHDLYTFYPDSEIPIGYVFHELHIRPWISTHYHDCPSKRHNLDLANQWYQEHNLESFQIHP